jgi:hypothetical protein
VIHFNQLLCSLPNLQAHGDSLKRGTFSFGFSGRRQVRIFGEVEGKCLEPRPRVYLCRFFSRRPRELRRFIRTSYIADIGVVSGRLAEFELEIECAAMRDVLKLGT